MLQLTPAYDIDMKRLLSLLFLLGILGLLPSKAYADCQPIYGGGETCTSYTFIVQKYVQVPGTNNYVSNLYSSGPNYSLSQTVNFRIDVINTGNLTISSISIVDILPQYLKFVSGPGTYNSNDRSLIFVVTNLGAGQTQSFYVNGQVYGSGVPQGITCVVNQVTGTDNNGNSSNSSSKYCIQRTISKVVTTPATGPEMLPLALLFPGALGGIILRKKSNKLDFRGGEK
jgi:uncharacterized repeat protein (TIGR01451 family)